MQAAFSDTLSRSIALLPSSSARSSLKVRKGFENLVVGSESVWSESWMSERGWRFRRRIGMRTEERESQSDFVAGPTLKLHQYSPSDASRGASPGSPFAGRTLTSR